MLKRLAFFGLGVLIVLYCAYWFTVSHIVQKTIADDYHARALHLRSYDSVSLQYTKQRVMGFPFLFQFEYHMPYASYSSANALHVVGLTSKTHPLRVFISPFFTHVRVVLPKNTQLKQRLRTTITSLNFDYNVAATLDFFLSPWQMVFGKNSRSWLKEVRYEDNGVRISNANTFEEYAALESSKASAKLSTEKVLHSSHIAAHLSGVTVSPNLFSDALKLTASEKTDMQQLFNEMGRHDVQAQLTREFNVKHKTLNHTISPITLKNDAFAAELNGTSKQTRHQSQPHQNLVLTLKDPQKALENAANLANILAVDDSTHRIEADDVIQAYRQLNSITKRTHAQPDEMKLHFERTPENGWTVEKKPMDRFLNALIGHVWQP